jgi:hypothetical protein
MALQYVHDFLDRIITGGPGNNPEFDAQRALWLQNITRGTNQPCLLQYNRDTDALYRAATARSHQSVDQGWS